MVERLVTEALDGMVASMRLSWGLAVIYGHRHPPITTATTTSTAAAGAAGATTTAEAWTGAATSTAAAGIAVPRSRAGPRGGHQAGGECAGG